MRCISMSSVESQQQFQSKQVRRSWDEVYSKGSTCGESPDNSFTLEEKKNLRIVSEKFETDPKNDISFKIKIKTELCKNWELSGFCPFKQRCSFAHGVDDIQTKVHLHQNFKTLPCKSYFSNGFCPYGRRCQYIHNEIMQIPKFKDYIMRIYKEKNISIHLLQIRQKQSFNNILNITCKSFNISSSVDSFLQKNSFRLNRLSRLPIFKQLTNQS